MGDGKDEDPGLHDAIEGAAKFYDFFSRVSSGEDPQTRKAARQMGRITVDEALNEISRAAERKIKSVEVSEEDIEDGVPLVEIEDTDEGVQVVIDLAKTSVNPDNISVGTDGPKMVVRDVMGDWVRPVEVEDEGEYGVFEAYEVVVQGQIVTIDASLSGVGEDEEADDEDVEDSVEEMEDEEDEEDEE